MTRTLDFLYKLLGDAVLLPLKRKCKFPAEEGWQLRTFADTQAPAYQGDLQAAVRRGGNIGVRLGPFSGNLVTIDIDDDKLVEKFITDNPFLAHTLRTRGSRGCNFWLRMKPGTSYPNSQAYYTLKTAENKQYGEWRVGGGKGAQTVIFGLHPDGMEYRILVNKPPLEIEFRQLHWFARAPGDDQPTAGVAIDWPIEGDLSNLDKRIRAYIDTMDIAIQGECGSNPTFRLACTLVNDWALDRESTIKWLTYYSQTRCRPPWSETEIKHKIDNALKATPRRSRGHLRNQ